MDLARCQTTPALEELNGLITHIFNASTTKGPPQANLIAQQFLTFLAEHNIPYGPLIAEGFRTRLWQMVVSRRTSAAHGQKELEAQDVQFCLDCPAYLLCIPRIVFEDDNYVVINKPWDYRLDRKANEQPQFINEPTLVEFIASHLQNSHNRAPPTERFVQRFCNQLDYATSGLMLFAKSSEACGYVGRQFSRGKVAKTYSALVLGRLDISSELPSSDSREPGVTVLANKDHIEVKLSLKEPSNGQFGMLIDHEGRPCSTKVVPQAYGHTPFPGHGLVPCTLLALYPTTGRRHQLRVSLASIGHPIVGDVFYGQKFAHLVTDHCNLDHSQMYRMCLHASEMQLALPNYPQAVVLKASDDFSTRGSMNKWLFIPSS